MTRMLLTAATRLLFNGLNLRLVEQRGDEVDWTCDRTRQSFTFNHGELATMVATGEATFQTTGGGEKPTVPEVPEEVDPQELAAAVHKLGYVLDMHKADLTYRPPLKAFEAQILATAKRLADPAPPEAWTVKRWLKRGGDAPTVWHYVSRDRMKGNHGVRLTDEQRAIVDQQIEERYLRRERITIETLTSVYVRNAVRVANLERPDDLRIAHVGRKAIASVLAERDPREVHAKRFGEAAAIAKFDKVDLQISPKAPLDRIEIDHTRADLFVVSDEDGLPIGRPWIGFAIDRCTRMPFGLYIGFEPPSVLTVMQILRNGIFPKTYVREKIASGEWDFNHDWPVWGMPRTLVFDRAMENLGHDLRAAAMEIGIRDLHFVKRRSGQQKGAVERYFRTQNEQLLHERRGTSYSNVIQRDDYDSKKNAVITMSALLKMTHRYFVDIYPHRKHAGLANDLPSNVWAKLIDRYPSDPVLPMDQMLHLFTRHKSVVVGREGVRFQWIFYQSDELSAVRNSSEFIKQSPRRKATLRYDPADLGRVWIRFPHREGYLEVPPADPWADYAPGTSVWEHLQIREHHRLTVGSVFNPDTLAESRVRLSEDMDEADSARKKLRARAKRARFQGEGRVSPAGSSHATTPVRSQHAAKMKAAQPPLPANDPRTSPSGATPIKQRRVKTLSMVAPSKKAS